MQVPAFDLTRQYSQIREQVEIAMNHVLVESQFILGKNVTALEEEIAAYCGVRYGIGVANGSDALHLALLAVGVGPGDEVVVPAFTFFATAGAVARAGAIPVFADIHPRTYNLDPLSFAKALTPRTKAVIPAHLYGLSAEMDRIMELAHSHNLYVIEDNAQSIGAEYKGQRTGSIGHLSTLSFFPTKNLAAFGDGGMVLTNDAILAERVRVLRVHGAAKKYHHTEMGYNSRLDEIQAAILRVKLRYLDGWTERRRKLAAEYQRLLAGTSVVLPDEIVDTKHVFHQFTIRVPQRDALQAHLQQRGIGSTIYYPSPLHLQPVFANLGGRPGTLPESERACREVLSLPMFPELMPGELEAVAQAICERLS